MSAVSVRRRNRRAVSPNDSYNWPDTFITSMELVTGTVTELQVEFNYPMMTEPHVGSIAFWNFRYWDTSANTTVLTPFVELVVLSETRQAWLLSTALSLSAPWQAEMPLDWDNFRPRNGGRVRGYDPQPATVFSVLNLPKWP